MINDEYVLSLYELRRFYFYHLAHNYLSAENTGITAKTNDNRTGNDH